MSDIYSFYQLIIKYQIEIPIIQRDYAQGRNNSKAANVRKSLVENMIKAVKEDKPLFFDFVYGRVDDKKFIPFDGQQRLTTLFLFHKYVFEKSQSDSGCNHKDNCSCGGILGRFSYATRQSSREFCEQLISNSVIPSKDYYEKIKDEYIRSLKNEKGDGLELKKKAVEHLGGKIDWMSSYIKNQPWFYPDWEKDPTVMGMLTMLDEIHCQMQKENETDFKTLAEKLTSGCNCPITFHFVDMGGHKMSDETYVKMNARGKQLTPFENFKASLEQYLEEKKQDDLKNLLKEKIDGVWLDLFWKIANPNEENKDNNEKNLPDSLIMSFFNRHFMNVWRCWYANSSKSEKKEEYDTFNTRIQKEMPLYPTKDNFVSFEIYSYVLDNCDVDECLTPIFNIWDTLYDKSKENDNSILNDCQAVWNRKEEGSKWNLYQGDKSNNNRETYPSRVAFYALMKYFKNSKDTASLPHWMRVVWNIIENSTIDSSDTYHAALRLIEKLSAKSHTIYNALANEFESFELGNQYHAKEQVTEEIAKANQFLNGAPRPDGKTWEEIIIEAENYAFFKGSVRFLFQNADGELKDWNNFDTKWKNVQEYFDKAGLMVDKYKNNCILLRKLISYFTTWENFKAPCYDNNNSNWRNYILLNSKLSKPVDCLLSVLVDDKVSFGDYTSQFQDEKIRKIQNQLVRTDLLCNLFRDGYYIEDAQRLHIYYDYRCNDIYLGDSVHENIILASLIKCGVIVCNQQVEHSSFFKDRDINFQYKYKNDKNEEKLYYFQWLGYKTEVDIYLMKDEGKDREKREPPTHDKNTDEDFYYCFKVTPDMEKNTKLFTDKLDELIAEASSRG